VKSRKSSQQMHRDSISECCTSTVVNRMAHSSSPQKDMMAA